MATKVCTGACLQCPFATAPLNLSVLPQNRVMTSSLPAANIMDNKPVVNLLPCMCQSMANPVVAAATAAKMGVLTPTSCIPVTPGPWIPAAPTKLLANMPVLTNNSKIVCVWGGVISITSPGQMTAEAS